MAKQKTQDQVREIKKLWEEYRYTHSAQDISCLTQPYSSPPTCRRHYPFPSYDSEILRHSQIILAMHNYPDYSKAEIGYLCKASSNTVRIAIRLYNGRSTPTHQPQPLAQLMPEKAEPMAGDTESKALTDDIEAQMYPMQTVDGGTKHDEAKLPYDLIPPEALDAVAEVLQYGAEKYGRRNWEMGMRWGRLFAATMRHLWSWWRGEELDDETGYSHLAHAACMIMFLIAYQERGKGSDDRGE